MSGLDARERGVTRVRRPATEVPMLRVLIGQHLRAHRRSQQRTLRDVATEARVSLGYLSEVERGQKEASSELLAAICQALGMPLSRILGEVTASVAAVERTSAVSVLPTLEGQRADGVAAA